MKNFLMLAAATLMLFSCQNEDATTDSSFKMSAAGADYTGACSLPVQTVSGDITTATTWTNDKVWEIDGVVRVKGAKLTIQAGTFIKAKPLAAGVAAGVLVVTKTGQIDAQGTANAPIVFTSFNLLDCNSGTVPAPGDFGGVVLLGDANVNNGLSNNVIEGLGDQTVNSADFQYGGTNDAHDAGDLKYVRIEYAGRILNALTGVEINGLTCGGVGSGTSIDYVQVTYGRDDSFEFFGGKVSASHLVSFACDDDNFDFDLGYTGTITAAIAIADTNSSHSLSSSAADSNGIELDNNPGGTVTTLITRPVIREMSIIGLQCPDHTKLENGIHVRRKGQIDMQYVDVTGYSYGIKWEDAVDPLYYTYSSWASMQVHGAVDDVLPAGTSLGFGNVTSTGCNAPTWGSSPYQPYFNLGSFNLSGSATGAFRSSTTWVNTWTKFSGF